MLHYDYHIDINYGHSIILDEELTFEKIQFQEGDLFQVCRSASGCVMLKKVDPVTKFTLGFPVDNDQ
jgi:hypothetical protein